MPLPLLCTLPLAGWSYILLSSINTVGIQYLKVSSPVTRGLRRHSQSWAILTTSDEFPGLVGS